MTRHPQRLYALFGLLIGGTVAAGFVVIRDKHDDHISPGGSGTGTVHHTTTTPSTRLFSFTRKTPQQTTFTSTIILGGDIMLSRDIGARNKKLGYDRTFAPGNPHPFAGIDSCVQGDCLMMFNLESPFSTNDRDKSERTFLFAAHTGNVAVLDGLRRPGMKHEKHAAQPPANTLVLSLANNHIHNAGGEGIATTITTLDHHNILHVGAGTQDTQARTILQFTHRTINRCVAAYSYDGGGGIYGGKPVYRNRLEPKIMLADIQRMKTDYTCDVKAVILHRGAEYRTQPSAAQITIAHSLIDAGVDIIIGGHSHIPGKAEIYSGKYIFYSLGNALFDQDRGRTNVGAGMSAITEFSRGKTLTNGTPQGAKTVPTYISIFPELHVEKKLTSSLTASGTTTTSGATPGTGNTTTITRTNTHIRQTRQGLFETVDEKTKEEVLKSMR